MKLALATAGMCLLVGSEATGAPRPRASAPKPAPLVSFGSLNRAGLIALSSLKETIPPRDPFRAEEPHSKYVDLPFTFAVKFTEGGDSAGATWKYNLESQTLVLKYQPPSYALGVGEELQSKSRDGGTYVGSNAFGVKKRIHAYGEGHFGVTFEAEPTGPYETFIPLPPEKARALVKDLVVIITGKTVAGSDGHVSACQSDHDGATMSDPVDLYTNTCATRVAVEKVTFYSSENGGGLATWPLPVKAASPASPAPVAADAEVTGPHVITRPSWLSKPTGDQFAAAYPDRAQRLGKEGRATLSCSVTASGSLSGCAIISEDPSDYGFGAAAQKLARYFAMRPSTDDGKAVGGGTVTVPIVFRQAPR